MKFNTIRPSYKRFPTQRAIIHIWNSGRLKEHLSTFELPPKRNPLRLSSFSQDSITTHSPYPLPNLIKIHQHPLKLLTDSNSKSTYIPLSCHQNAIPLRFSSYSQGSITTHSPCTPPNLNEIHRHPSELHSTPTQRALIYLWVAAKTRSPSDLAHIYSTGSTHSAHVFIQILMKSNDTCPSYKQFPTQRAIIHIWNSGRLKEHLYTFESLPKRNPLRLSSFSQDSITTHSPYPHPNLIKIHQHPLKLLSDSNSKSTYIPLSCRQNAIPLRLSSCSQDR